MGYVPRRKLDTAEYPAVRVPHISNRRATLAYLLYSTEMKAYGNEPAEWGALSRATRSVYLTMAQAVLEWKE